MARNSSKKKVKVKREEPPSVNVRRLCGYVAISAHSSPASESGEKTSVSPCAPWIYLRRHAENQLFIGNLPWPTWHSSDTQLDLESQTRVQTILRKLLPSATSVDIPFAVGVRLAARATLPDASALAAVLSHPGDYVFIAALDELRTRTPLSAETMLTRLLHEHMQMRDETTVTKWSNAAMRAFEARERAATLAKEQAKAAANVPDEDGFVTVTSGPAQIKAEDAARTSVNKTWGKAAAARNRRVVLDVAKGIEKPGFYRWQRRERNGFAKLRDEFRADRRRVAAIRALGDTSSAAHNEHSDGVTKTPSNESPDGNVMA